MGTIERIYRLYHYEIRVYFDIFTLNVETNFLRQEQRLTLERESITMRLQHLLGHVLILGIADSRNEHRKHKDTMHKHAMRQYRLQFS